MTATHFNLSLMFTLKIFSTFGTTAAGESTIGMRVNSSAKLLVSSSLWILGTKGAGIRFAARSLHFIFCKQTQQYMKAVQSYTILNMVVADESSEMQTSST